MLEDSSAAAKWQRTACILCSENCGLEVKVVERRLLGIRGDRDHPESRGYICQKAARLDFYQNHADRLDQPLARLADGSFKPVSWDTAIADIAKRLLAIRKHHGGKSIAYYGGGGQGNHLGAVYASAFRKAVGTPYLYSSLAQEKTGDFWVNGKLFGRQSCHTTCDIKNADFVLFLGTNPWQSHGFPRARKVLLELQRDPDRMMVVVDPRRTETARMADIHLRVQPGADAFLLAAILRMIVDEKLYDHDFLDHQCLDADMVIEVLKKLPLAEFVKRSGICEQDIRRVARSLANAKSASIRADLGIQQSLNSTLNSYLEKLLFLLSGNWSRKGTNSLHSALVPLMGHSSESDRELTRVTEMAPIARLYPPNVLPAEIMGDDKKRLRAVFVDSTNPIVSAADTQAYTQAFKQLELLVVIDVALTETAHLADYVLPASSQYEKAEATFFSFGFPRNAFHLRSPIVSPLAGTLPEAEIYRRLCVAMGALPERFPILEQLARWQGHRAFKFALGLFFAFHRKLIGLAPLVLYSTVGKALPPQLKSAAALWGVAHLYVKRSSKAVRRAGIAGKNLGEALFERILSEPGGFIFSEHRYDDPLLHSRHPDGKIHLAIPELLEQLQHLAATTAPANKRYPFVLMAGERRSYNANTIYRPPEWRKTDKQGALRIHPDDAQSLGIVTGARVLLSSHSGSLEVVVEVNDSALRGALSIPNGYGLSHPSDGQRVQTGPNLNQLTSATHCDPLSKTPFHKNVPVRVEVLGGTSQQ